MNKYIIYLKSTPGMYAQYSGKVEVWNDSSDSDELLSLAIKKLKGTFPDRQSTDFWKIERIEVKP